MLQLGIAKKVTIHLNEDTAAKRDFLYHEIFTFLLERGVAGATMIRPDAGFGSHHRVHEGHGGPDLAVHLPIRIEFIDSPEKVASLMPELCAFFTDGLIEAQDTVVYKSAERQEPML